VGQASPVVATVSEPTAADRQRAAGILRGARYGTRQAEADVAEALADARSEGFAQGWRAGRAGDRQCYTVTMTAETFAHLLREAAAEAKD
jgi:flagellar biosynthesis/type III secretory pathway protein FliH